MELVPALQRVGAVIIKQTPLTGSSITLYFRVDPKCGDKWVETITSFLLGGVGKPYKIDLSKYFYVDKGDVRYQWRLWVSGEEAPAALSLLAQCALEASAAHTLQFDSFPLVGRVEYPFDPLRGKIKGAHDRNASEGIIAMAAGGGVPGGVP